MFKISYRIIGTMYGTAPPGTAMFCLLPVDLEGELMRRCTVIHRWSNGARRFRYTINDGSVPRLHI